MNDVLEFYKAEAEDLATQDQAIAAIQKAGLAAFLKQGLPTRHDEAWKYSPPNDFLNARFARQEEALVLEGAPLLRFDEACRHYPHLLHYLPKIKHEDNGFQTLNAAMLSTIHVIYLKKGEVSLRLNHTPSVDKGHFTQVMLVLEEGASCHLIESYQGKGCYFNNHMMDVFLAPHAQLTHVLIQEESHQALHYSHTFAHLSAHSQLNSHVLQLGGKWVRADQSIFLEGSHAHALLNGVYSVKGDTHLDQHTLVSHETVETSSEQDYKGILSGHAQGVFNGRVIVAPHAQKTKAIQQNKNLLLSKDAEVDTKPQLEIMANDVMCTHGATVGQLSEEALFYFATRGIKKEEAIRFLIAGFVSANLEKLADKKMEGIWQEHLKEQSNDLAH